MHNLTTFLGGTICMGECVIALLFARFAARTRDALFGWFAAAFALLAIERVLLLWQSDADQHPTIYVTRLLAFACIIFAIVDRNRRRS